ncbi:MAG: hypothetical protein P4L77_11915 [Sulfuriferula sp.]|nr:hypothetical protein [Sulfuriferula sp.]
MSAITEGAAALAESFAEFGSAVAAVDEGIQGQVTTLSNTVSNIALVRGLFNALVVTSTGSNAAVSVTALEMTLKDGNGHVVVISNVNLSANTKPAGQAGTGAGSLDTGNFASNTWYALYVAYSSTLAEATAILSLNSTAPALPSGYTFYTRVAWVRTDGTANAYPLSFTQKGAQARYDVRPGSNVPALPIIASGAAGDCTIPTWVGLPWAAFAPPTTTDLRLLTGSNGGSCTVMVAPNANFGAWNSTTNLPPIMHSNVGSYLFTDDDVTVESPDVYWASNAGAQPPTPGTAGNYGIVAVMGWTDNI